MRPRLQGQGQRRPSHIDLPQPCSSAREIASRALPMPRKPGSTRVLAISHWARDLQPPASGCKPGACGGYPGAILRSQTRGGRLIHGSWWSCALFVRDSRPAAGDRVDLVVQMLGIPTATWCAANIWETERPQRSGRREASLKVVYPWHTLGRGGR